MQWLKTVTELHGSVEKSSLSRAQLINTEGLYVIEGVNVDVPSVENCLKLHLPSHGEDGGNQALVFLVLMLKKT